MADGLGVNDQHDHDAGARLDHENLDVYRCAIEALKLALQAAEALPRGQSELMKQPELVTDAKRTLVRIVAMLTRMCR